MGLDLLWEIFVHPNAHNAHSKCLFVRLYLHCVADVYAHQSFGLNHGNHKNWAPSMLPHNLWMISIVMKQKKEFWIFTLKLDNWWIQKNFHFEKRFSPCKSVKLTQRVWMILKPFLAIFLTIYIIFVFIDQSWAILSSFKIVVLFNNTSADFVLISVDVLLKMILFCYHNCPELSLFE